MFSKVFYKILKKPYVKTFHVISLIISVNWQIDNIYHQCMLIVDIYRRKSEYTII